MPLALGRTAADAERFRQRMRTCVLGEYAGFAVQVPVALEPDGEHLWFRLSCAAYNHAEEFIALRDAVLALVAEAEAAAAARS
jgi:hypothetical protein